jgi:hypothetical protein
MIRRSLFAALLTGAALLPASSAFSAVRISFGKPVLNPKRVAFSGGPVTVRIKITARGGHITGVTGTARLVGSGASSSATSFRTTGRGIWTGNISVPGNYSKKGDTADVVLTVQTGGGHVVRRIARIPVNPSSADPNQPPPPPPI